MHPVYSKWSYSDGWQAVHVRHFEQPYEFDETWIADLMNRTGAPVLMSRETGVETSGRS